MNIAFPSSSTAAKNKFAGPARNIDKRLRFEIRISKFKFLGRELVNDSPEWHFHNFVGTCAACNFLPHAVPAVFRLDDRLVKKIRYIIDVSIRSQDDVAAESAVAAIEAALRHNFFSLTTHTTATA